MTLDLIQPIGLYGVLDMNWNRSPKCCTQHVEIKVAYELQYEHACGRSIAPPTFLTFGPAFTFCAGNMRGCRITPTQWCGIL